jgi:pilus assembly protein CpaE
MTANNDRRVNMTLRLTLLAPDQAQLAPLLERVRSVAPATAVDTVVGGPAALGSHFATAVPDLVVAQLGPVDDAQLASLEQLLAGTPATAVVVLSTDRSPEFLLRMMRAGVREIVPLPLSDGELPAALRRQIDRMQGQRASSLSAKVVAFMPAKGGSGATFLAANFAFALAMRGKRVALIDLNLHFGDAVMFLSDLRPEVTIGSLAKQADRLDAALLEASMVRLSDTLWALPAPESPESAIDVRPDFVEKLLSIARGRFDFVVLDVGRILDSIVVGALDQTDSIMVVLQATLPFIHDARRLVGVLRGIGYSRDKISLVLNRAWKGGQITDKDIERTLGLAIRHEIPNRYEVVEHCINHGLAVLQHAPKDPVARAIETMADAYAPAEKVRAGWFRSLVS